MIALKVGGLGKLRLLHMKAHVKAQHTNHQVHGDGKENQLDRAEFSRSLPNRIEQGMATICVTSRAMIIPVVSRPKIGAIAGCHVDYRAHTVNIEKISDDKNKNRLIPKKISLKVFFKLWKVWESSLEAGASI